MSVCRHFWEVLRTVEESVEYKKECWRYRNCQFFSGTTADCIFG